MSVKPGLVVEYARAFQKLETAPDRAPKIAGELDRLIAGVFAVSSGIQFGDDPSDFLATLLELRDAAERRDE